MQLWRLLLYRERRLSYQSLCLFLCLLWAALRTTLFSAAFSLSGSLPLLRPPARLHFFPHWLLYCFPSCLQFSTLCLLNLYLAEPHSHHRCSHVLTALVPLASADGTERLELAPAAGASSSCCPNRPSEAGGGGEALRDNRGLQPPLTPTDVTK
ncbi:Integral membrane protein GPR137C [Myotis brandtii]|uniref:Integral membrane protein GPR137C n=1 Tax=Myotis brandtii TaxID=109478 RepID=S7MW53_MYOBR|nr:Integral membrane protein GPR137C [Myotis brandtii]